MKDVEFTTLDSGARENLANGMVRDVETDKIDYTLVLDGPLFERWAALMTRGATKYGPRNWTKALESTDAAARELTTERFRRSAFRHMMQWLADDRGEDHAAAVIFNLNGAEAMRDTDRLAGAAPLCVACKGVVSNVKREPKVGDRVRVIKCNHARDAVNVEGAITRIDPRGRESLPYYVCLDKPSATHGQNVWCETVEVLHGMSDAKGGDS